MASRDHPTAFGTPTADEFAVLESSVAGGWPNRQPLTVAKAAARVPAPKAAAARPVANYKTVRETVVYKKTPLRDLHLEIVRPVAVAPEPPRACVVFFHGGGWRRGSPTQFLPYCELLAQRGIVGISAEYRLLARPEDMIPTEAIADARSAMRWVHANAGRLGCDATRIGAGGGSSGGHLALMTALRSPVDDPADDLAIDPRPALLVLMNTPFDFDDYAPELPIEQRRAYSPTYLLDADLPPALILHGTNDKVVPYSQLARFRERAQALDIDGLKVVPFKGRGHGFFNRGGGEPGDFSRVAVEIGAFLIMRAWL